MKEVILAGVGITSATILKVTLRDILKAYFRATRADITTISAITYNIKYIKASFWVTALILLAVGWFKFKLLFWVGVGWLVALIVLWLLTGKW